MRAPDGYFARTKVGGIRAAQADYYFFPTRRRGATKYPAILLHGAGGEYAWMDVTKSASNELGPRLAMAGIPALGGQMSNDTWANDTGMTDITTATNLAKTAFGLPTVNKFHLLGGSMGGAMALRWAILNPEKVASLTLIFPLYDIHGFYAIADAPTKAALATAWGVVSPAALPAAANLPNLIGAVQSAGIPAKIYYSATDTLVLPATTLALATALEETAVNVGNNGHSETTIRDVINGHMQSIIDFMQANGG